MNDTRTVVELCPATVFACLRTGWLTIVLFPGFGMADGGTFREYPMCQIPYPLRMPNTRLYLLIDKSNHELVKVLPRNFGPGTDVDDLILQFATDGTGNLEERIRQEMSKQRKRGV
jgi:hypothetical protein